MALLTKVRNSLNVVMVVNNITTLISKQTDKAIHSEQDCISKYANYGFEKGDIFCSTTFDTYLCWPPTKANTVIQQNCPEVRLSDPSKFAFRQCGANGLWAGRYANEASARGWTNFTPCFPSDLQALIVEVFNKYNEQTHILSNVHISCRKQCMEEMKIVEDNVSRIYDKENLQVETKYEIAQESRLIEITGYISSFVAILVSVIIFSAFRSLLNQRVLIHIGLFITILIQIIIHLVLYLDQTYFYYNDYLNQYKQMNGLNSIPSLCAILYVMLEISITTVFMWMLLEGVYLYLLVSKYALQANFIIKKYFCTAWLAPLFMTAIWAIINVLFYKDESVKTCWFGYNLASSYWLLQGPRLLIIAVNVAILCIVLYTIILKLSAHESSDIEKLKKASKAAFLLLPLLGITNILTTFDISITTSVSAFKVWCYARQFLKSFQGLFLSLLYCFGNNDVRTVVFRRFKNLKSRLLCRDELTLDISKKISKKDEAERDDPTIPGEKPLTKVQIECDPNEPGTSARGLTVTVDMHEAEHTGLETAVMQPVLRNPKLETIAENVPMTWMDPERTPELETNAENIPMNMLALLGNEKINKNTDPYEETSFTDA